MEVFSAQSAPPRDHAVPGELTETEGVWQKREIGSKKMRMKRGRRARVEKQKWTWPKVRLML